MSSSSRVWRVALPQSLRDSPLVRGGLGRCGGRQRGRTPKSGSPHPALRATFPPRGRQRGKSYAIACDWMKIFKICKIVALSWATKGRKTGISERTFSSSPTRRSIHERENLHGGAAQDRRRGSTQGHTDPEKVQAGQGASGAAAHRERAVLEAAPLAGDGQGRQRRQQRRSPPHQRVAGELHPQQAR